MGRIKSNYNFRDSARIAHWDSVTQEMIQMMFPLSYYDDFLGAGVVIPASGAAESGVDWVKKITGAGPPTVAVLANGGGGVLQCAFTAADQKQEAGAYFNDQLTFDITKGLIWEARVKLSVLPTLLTEMQWGLASAYVEDIASVASKVGFDADGNGQINAGCDDNVTDTLASTGMVVTNANWKIYRFECTDVNDIKFFIDGNEVCSSTRFSFTATGANAIVQPYFYVYKSTGEGLGTMQVDYVKIWTAR